MKIIKKLAIPVLAVVLVGGGLLGYRRLRGGGQAETYTQVVAVERGDILASIAPTGEVYAPREAELGFDVNRIELIELNVTAGQQVKAGDVLARIDTTSLKRAVTQAEANLTITQNELEKAQNPYDELDLARARRAVAQAEVELENAKKHLIVVQNDPDNAERLRQLEYEATWYRNNYGEALKKFEEGKKDKEKLDLEYSNMLAAEERLRTAQTNAEIALAEAEDRVPQAEYDLAKARDDLAEIEAGPDPDEVEVAEAKVTLAQAELEEAQENLEAATMTAPFDGTVIDVGAEVGDLVSADTIVVTLAELSKLEVKTMVDETDISQVELGQEAEITFDAFPGLRFTGEVLSVPLQGKLSQNVVTYEVPVSLEGAEGVSLKPGMTANLKIIVGRRENVLLVPAMAVQYGEGLATVMVQDDPDASPVSTNVEVGLSDGVYTEIVRGLNEGDRVAIVSTPVEEEGGFPGGPGLFGIPSGGPR